MSVTIAGILEHFLAQLAGSGLLRQVHVFVMPVGVAIVRVLTATRQANVQVLYLAYSLT